MRGERCVSRIKSQNINFCLREWIILFELPYIKTLSNFLNLTILGKIQEPSDNDSKLNECLCLVRWMVTLHKRGIMIYYTICPIHCGFRFIFCLSIVRLGFVFFIIITCFFSQGISLTQYVVLSICPSACLYLSIVGAGQGFFFIS